MSITIYLLSSVVSHNLQWQQLTTWSLKKYCSVLERTNSRRPQDCFIFIIILKIQDSGNPF